MPEEYSEFVESINRMSTVSGLPEDNELTMEALELAEFWASIGDIDEHQPTAQ